MGFIDIFEDLGAEVYANACGPCIGQWSRDGADKKQKNSIIHSFNRNFAKRADGNPNTHAFVASPEIVTALAIAGDLTFNPLKSKLIDNHGDEIVLEPPKGSDLPKNGFAVENLGYQEPLEDGSKLNIKVNPESSRLQLLKPFQEWDGKNFSQFKVTN